jgi:hypothetical protein
VAGCCGCGQGCVEDTASHGGRGLRLEGDLAFKNARRGVSPVRHKVFVSCFTHAPGG